MGTKIKWYFFSLIIVIYLILWKYLYNKLSLYFNLFLGFVFIIMAILLITWLYKKTDRVTELFSWQLSTVFPILGYVGGLVFIGLGIFSLFLDSPNKFTMFLIMIITGLIVLFIIFFMSKKWRKYKKK